MTNQSVLAQWKVDSTVFLAWEVLYEESVSPEIFFTELFYSKFNLRTNNSSKE